MQYFTLYGYNSCAQGLSLARDLKMSQYTKLPPRVTLFVQSLGTIIGAILQLIIMKSVISAQRELLLDTQGSNIWSGQQVQSFNSQAVSWGALAKVRPAFSDLVRWRSMSDGVGRKAVALCLDASSPARTSSSDAALRLPCSTCTAPTRPTASFPSPSSSVSPSPSPSTLRTSSGPSASDLSHPLPSRSLADVCTLSAG